MDEAEVRHLVDSLEPSELIAVFERLVLDTDPESVERLRAFLLYRDNGLAGKHVTPRLVARALIQKGPVGVEALYRSIPDAPGAIYPQAIVEAIWYASQGRLPLVPWLDDVPGVLGLAPDPDTQAAAQDVLEEIVIQSASHEIIFERLIGFLFGEMQRSAMRGEEQGLLLRTRVFEVLSESTIKLSRRLLRDFQVLINEDHREEVYQQFLMANPVLIDPLASTVIPKQKLGLEFITDFAVRRHDRRYILVEIEKPQDRLFTEGNDFTAGFTHAIGQVLDFQQWVDQNGAYAQKLLPDISSPRGLLVMGRRAALTVSNAEKLHRFSLNSSAIDVMTFDDLLLLATNLYRSLHSESPHK